MMLWEVEHIVNGSTDIWAGQKSEDKPKKSLEEIIKPPDNLLD